MKLIRFINTKGLHAILDKMNDILIQDQQLDMYDFSEMEEEMNSLPLEQNYYVIPALLTKSGKDEEIALELAWFDYVV